MEIHGCRFTTQTHTHQSWNDIRDIHSFRACVLCVCGDGVMPIILLLFFCMHVVSVGKAFGANGGVRSIVESHIGWGIIRFTVRRLRNESHRAVVAGAGAPNVCMYV